MKRQRQTHTIAKIQATLFTQDKKATYAWEGTESQWQAFRVEHSIRFDDIVSIKTIWGK